MKKPSDRFLSGTNSARLPVRLGCKNKIVGYPGQHALHGLCLGHLILEVIELYGAKPLGVKGQHIFCGNAWRVKVGIDPLGERAAAGAHIQSQQTTVF